MIEQPLVVVRSYTDMFGQMFYFADLLITEMVPTRMARRIGTFRTREEAQAAGDAALTATNGDIAP